MSAVFSLRTLTIAGILIIVVTMTSPNAALWAACLLTLPVAVWLLGGKQAYGVLILMIGLTWLQVIGDVISADLVEKVISEDFLGPYRIEAIILSLCAITAL